MLLPSYEINKIGDQMHSMLLYNYQYCIIYLNVFKRVDLKCYHHLCEKNGNYMKGRCSQTLCGDHLHYIHVSNQHTVHLQLTDVVSQQYLSKAGLEGEDPCRAEKVAG